MQKKMAFVVVALLGLSIIAPATVFAQEIPITPDLLPPVGMVVFGFLGLVGGTLGYIWRQRKS